MKKHALYIRVSTEAQADEGYSISAQQQRLEGYCQSKGWTQYESYIDGGFSGSHIQRPAISRLIEEVKESKIETVVVYKLDRLSRSQKDTLYLIEDVFLPYGVDFVSLNESIDTSTPYGRAMIGILSAFAQLERENIFLRTRMGMQERVKQGYWMGGGSTPFGYDYDKEQGILVPNPEESQVVEQIYHLYLKGYSPQKIAQLLGLKYDRLVTQILSRRSNLGLITYRGEEYQGKHKPLISKEIFDLAQQKRKSREVGARAGGNYLLSGLVFCGSCGGRMRYVKWGKKGYKLRCYSQDPSKTYMKKGECNAPAVWATEVEDIVKNDLFHLSTKLNESSHSIRNPIADLKKQITIQENKLKRFYHLYAQGEESTLLELIEEGQSALQTLKESLKEEEQSSTRKQQLEGVRNQVCTIKESWQYLTHRQRQELFKDCVEKVEIEGDKVAIYYHFLEKEG